ncbi:sugar phosphate isomerase/epimerase [Eubacteriales bacterium OttesenSCG-928-G02]|nr:sugar phosphate isomerase/epimerase [Eubacteriales bacterium OttesenSCG-928-G02]
MLPIALQLYSIRGYTDKDFFGTLQKVKDMGYDGVEFTELNGYSPEEVKKQLDNIGLIPVSAHVSYTDMCSNYKQMVADYAKIGCKTICIPYLAPEFLPTGDNFDEAMDNFRKFGEETNKYGIPFAYHNHAFEFEKYNGEYILDIIFNSVSPDLLETQIDTAWANKGGVDPIQYIKKYKNRATTIHLKDLVLRDKNPANEYHNSIETSFVPIADNENDFGYRPIGYGIQDIPGLLKAFNEIGCKYVIVEQDEPSMGLTSIECAEKSINSLRKLLGK